VKHGCRTLIKQGHKPTLAALGYKAAQVKLDSLEIRTPRVHLGGQLEFALALSSTTARTQPLIIDFIIHHRKANGETTPKVFKWKVVDLPGRKQLAITKKHPMKPITTRTYYAGKHGFEIQINGESFGRAEFEFFI